uniref:MPN domain-containing protein n=1 Tax=Homalodisca liturata TaxID=320908 RepID=A0A1B6HV73_9HEMI
MLKTDQKFAVDIVSTPEERLKRLLTDYASVDIDASIPPKRYYRSGLEMVRMANVYREEGQLENAYILYMKFIVLFLEKTKTHPGWNTLPVTNRAVIQQKLREVFPKAEQLKSELSKKFEEEYERFLKDEKRREEERARLENERRKMAASVANNVKIGVVVPPHPSLLLEPVPPLPDELNYNLEPSAPFPPQPSPRQKPTPDTLRLPPSTAVPGVDRSTKPMSLLSPTSQQRLGLRTVVVPQILHAKFILLAQRSTEKNIETCGILAGRLDHDHLVISHLIVPKQHGGADYCNMDNEEEICEYSDQRELLTLGWIHTHPTQSAFLSSVDLHTHFSYQLMMPEAIAIVCAPKYQEVKVFCLTPFHGLDFIKNCRQPGFHPHPNDPPLFMVAEHYRMDTSASLELVDLRR